MKQIAIVALAPGQVGFYDDLSGIHLSLANREARVLKGMNTAGLVNAVQSGKITVVSGSLGLETFLYEDACKAIPTYYRLLNKKKKKLLKSQIIKPIENSEPTKEENKETVVAVEIEIEKSASATEEAVAEDFPVVEEVPSLKKRTRKKKVEETIEEVKKEEE